MAHSRKHALIQRILHVHPEDPAAKCPGPRCAQMTCRANNLLNYSCAKLSDQLRAETSVSPYFFAKISLRILKYKHMSAASLRCVPVSVCPKTHCILKTRDRVETQRTLHYTVYSTASPSSSALRKTASIAAFAYTKRYYVVNAPRQQRKRAASGPASDMQSLLPSHTGNSMVPAHTKTLPKIQTTFSLLFYRNFQSLPRFGGLRTSFGNSKRKQVVRSL